MIDLFGKTDTAGFFFCIIALIIPIIRRGRVVHALFEGSAKFCPVTEGKGRIVRPSGMAGNDFDRTSSLLQILLKLI